MYYNTALFKIGGKILEDLENLDSTISQLEQLYNENLIEKIILIPGGGTLANFIRKVYRELKFTEELAHWMGIVSMNYNGLELNKKFPNFEITEDFNRLKKLDKSLSIFLPYEFLKENDKLPHSWDVTSDSISLFIANELGLNECFLVKDVEGILDSKNQVIKEISTSRKEVRLKLLDRDIVKNDDIINYLSSIFNDNDADESYAFRHILNTGLDGNHIPIVNYHFDSVTDGVDNQSIILKLYEPVPSTINNLRIITMNQEMVRITGFKIEELKGKKIDEIKFYKKKEENSRIDSLNCLMDKNLRTSAYIKTRKNEYKLVFVQITSNIDSIKGNLPPDIFFLFSVSDLSRIEKCDEILQKDYTKANTGYYNIIGKDLKMEEEL